MSDQPYAQSHGLRLLQTIVQECGPLFTREQVQPVAEAQGLSSGHLSKLLSVLNAAGHIERLKRGVYVVRPPLFNGDLHPFAIAAALVQPAAISHWSALAHHGFTTQLPTLVQASTPSAVVTPEMRAGGARRPRDRAVWTAAGVEVEYVHLQPARFFGHQHLWVDNWQQVAITDLERTALDLIARSDIFGGMSAAIEILEDNLSRLNLTQLVDYALRYHMGAVIKRLGWVLEHLSVNPARLAPLQAYPVTTLYRLDPRAPSRPSINHSWHINENLPEGLHA